MVVEISMVKAEQATSYRTQLFSARVIGDLDMKNPLFSVGFMEIPLGGKYSSHTVLRIKVQPAKEVGTLKTVNGRQILWRSLCWFYTKALRSQTAIMAAGR